MKNIEADYFEKPLTLKRTVTHAHQKKSRMRYKFFEIIKRELLKSGIVLAPTHLDIRYGGIYFRELALVPYPIQANRPNIFFVNSGVKSRENWADSLELK